MSIEISVKVSNEERSLTEKHLEYSESQIVLSREDHKLLDYVTKAVQNFRDPVDKIKVKINMVWE